MKTDVVIKYDIREFDFRVMIIGNKRVISTSKIKKIIAMRKKCSENGSREEDLGSNPHSKGDLFSRSVMVFLDVKFRTIIRMSVISLIIVAIMNRIWIIYTIF